MAEADLGKIVGMIMENPELVEKIKALASENSTETQEKKLETSEPVLNFTTGGSHRQELLHALGGFLSPERRRTLESMSSVLEILDTMRSK